MKDHKLLHRLFREIFCENIVARISVYFVSRASDNSVFPETAGEQSVFLENLFFRKQPVNNLFFQKQPVTNLFSWKQPVTNFFLQRQPMKNVFFQKQPLNYANILNYYGKIMRILVLRLPPEKKSRREWQDRFYH